MGHCGKVSKICDCLVGRTALLKTVHAITGFEAIGVDKNVPKKNNMNFFVIGLAKIYIYRLYVYYIHTAGVLLLHHSVDEAVINYHHLKTRDI
jgi:hypothetical protein